jgi:hypothetical protein
MSGHTRREVEVRNECYFWHFRPANRPAWTELQTRTETCAVLVPCAKHQKIGYVDDQIGAPKLQNKKDE